MDLELKPKDELLKEIFAYVRGEGRIPWINNEDSDDDHITVDEICIHGKSWQSSYLKKDENSDLWELESSGEGDEFCQACEPDCDCGQPHKVTCPICKAPWPKFPEERLIEAWEKRQNLEHVTRCPKCEHAWTLSMEEMQKLHPEVMAKYAAEGGKVSSLEDEDEDYRKFAERQDAIIAAMENAYEECPKDKCPADVNYVHLEDGVPCGGGGPIHKCDFDDLAKRFPGTFAIETPELSYGPEHDLKRPPKPAPRPMRNGRPVGKNADCPCGSGKKYKRCCLK